jgi:hypothetical protein
MSELWQTTLFIVMGGWLAIMTGAGFAFAFTISNRMTRMETTFELMGSNAFKAMHSPSDHLELDGLVEKYEANNNDLPMEDWEAVLNRCTMIASNQTKPREDRLAAGLCAAFAKHKLMRFAHLKKIIPP